MFLEEVMEPGRGPVGTVLEVDVTVDVTGVLGCLRHGASVTSGGESMGGAVCGNMNAQEVSVARQRRTGCGYSPGFAGRILVGSVTKK
jgi:hypothetical protein